MQHHFLRLNVSDPIKIIRLCFSQMIPVLVIGSFALMLYTIPINPYLDFIKTFCGGIIYTLLFTINEVTLEIISLYLLISFPIAFCTEKGIKHKSFYVFMCIASYITYLGGVTKVINLTGFKPQWMFIALVISCICCISAEHSVRLLGKKYNSLNEHNFSMSAFTFIFGALLLGVFSIIGYFLGATVYLNWLPQFFTDMFSSMGRNFFTALLFVFLVHFMWLFGMHGNNIMDGVSTGFFQDGMTINNTLIASGHAPTEIYTKTFLDTFVLLGGCGCSLCIVLAILIISRKKQRRYIAKGGLLPCIFNISEMVVFGFPVILNPVMLVPFIATPIVVLSTSSLATVLGWVPVVSHAITWTTPVVLSGYLATGSIAGCVLQAVNVVIGTLIYMPFIHYADNLEDESYAEDIHEVSKELLNKERLGFIAHPLADNGKYKKSVENLLLDFYSDLEKGNVQMYYQPQVNNSDKIVGAEALLRWKHPGIGYVAPPLIIAMAKDDDFGLELGYKIIEWTCKDTERLNKAGFTDYKISVNIAAFQLEDPQFCDKIKSIIQRYDFGSCSLFLEMTEREAMSVSVATDRISKELKAIGVGMILDDFGMGHNSLTYITKERFKYIKIDGELTKDILNNQRSAEIVKSLCGLSSDLNCQVIAEYVENDRLRDALNSLGCHIYQGYLFSPALPFEEFKEYCTHKADDK